MNKSVKKFLQFKGKSLLFLSKDGICWIAIKPVCEAIGVEYTRAFKNVKEDAILGPALAIQPMQVPGDDQIRSFSSLPEYLIYGWLFSIHSDSPELLEYKKECYQVLFNFFNGTITGRKNLLLEKAIIQQECKVLVTGLREIENFTRYEQLRAKEARLGISLKRIETLEIKEQLDLFNN